MNVPNRRLFQAAALTALVLMSVQGCASSAAPREDAGASPRPDGASPPSAIADAGDGGAPTRIPPRELATLGGPILARPTIVPIFFGDDPDKSRTEDLLTALPGSSYWKTLQEYGVGDVTLAPSVLIAANAPATYSLADIENKVAAVFERTLDPAPKPDGSQIYVLILPTKTTLRQADGSAFCEAGGAYHDSRGKEFAYAIVPHCTPSFDDYAVSLTHELIEAATDPYPLVQPAWASTDPDHVGSRAEVGDLCDFQGGIDRGALVFGAPMFGTRVERIFSNERSRKDVDPCSPDLGYPYFGATPVVLPDRVNVPDPVLEGGIAGNGVRVPVGATRTVKLLLHGPATLGPWTVAAQALAPFSFGPSRSLDVSLSRESGAPGDEITVSVTRTRPMSQTGDLVWITSTRAEATWYDAFFVAE